MPHHPWGGPGAICGGGAAQRRTCTGVSRNARKHFALPDEGNAQVWKNTSVSGGPREGRARRLEEEHARERAGLQFLCGGRARNRREGGGAAVSEFAVSSAGERGMPKLSLLPAPALKGRLIVILRILALCTRWRLRCARLLSAPFHLPKNGRRCRNPLAQAAQRRAGRPERWTPSPRTQLHGREESQRCALWTSASFCLNTDSSAAPGGTGDDSPCPRRSAAYT